MRIYDEKNFNVLDSSHFRFVELHGTKIKFYNFLSEKIKNQDYFEVDCSTEEDAAAKFARISKEVGWVIFQRGNSSILLNTFCFRHFYLKEKNQSYSVVFSNGASNGALDQISITCNSFDQATKFLKFLSEM